MESLTGDDDESISALFEPELEESWSIEEDKTFESVLSISPEEEDPNRLELITCCIPWRTADQLKKRYQELVVDVNAIEDGQVPFPEYNDRNLWESVVEEDERPELSKNKVPKQKRNPECRWTVQEHKLFLEGLEKLGNGDWRGIARQYVTTRLPSQVASHAQKYHLRKSGQGTSKKTRKRKSIHDITLDQDGSRTQDPEQVMAIPENSQKS